MLIYQEANFRCIHISRYKDQSIPQSHPIIRRIRRFKFNHIKELVFNKAFIHTRLCKDQFIHQ